MKNSTLSLIGSLGLLLIAVSVVIPVLSGGFPESSLYKILFTAGAVVCFVSALFIKSPQGATVRERRRSRLEIWSGLFFCAGAFFLWYPESQARDWLAFTLAGAVLRIIVFFMSFSKK